MGDLFSGIFGVGFYERRNDGRIYQAGAGLHSMMEVDELAGFHDTEFVSDCVCVDGAVEGPGL